MCAGMLAGLSLVLPESVSGADFPQGLMLHFNFDEAPAAGLIPDRSGRGYDGHATGAVWTAAGKRGGGFAFASSNQCIVVSNYPALRLKQATYAVWFRTPASNAAARVILDKGMDPRCLLLVAGTAPEEKERGRLRAVLGGQSCLGTNVVADGAWHHAAATFDGETLKLYVDGDLQKQTPVRLAEAPAGDGDLVIGMKKSAAGPGDNALTFNGTIDDLMIFNHALSGAEVGAVIAAVKPKFTHDQVIRRIAELKGLLDRGLILQDFYDRKVKECEAGE